MRRPLILNTGSIRNKLVLICILTTASALLFASLIFITTELVAFRHTMVNNLTTTAETIGSNMKAALAFKDNRSAEEILNTLSGLPNVTLAIVYDNNGSMFSTYVKNNTIPIPHTPLPRHDAYHFGFNHIDLYHQVTLDKEAIGTVYIQSDLKHFYRRVIHYVVTFLVVMILSLVMSSFLFTRLQKTVTRPIFELAELMDTISRRKDYSIRAAINNKDEIGALAEGFNEMVANIQSRDVELEQYRKNLEDLVRKRTSQLSDINKQLHQELTERLKAEKALTESEYQYRTMFETSGNANTMIDADDTVTMVNTAFEKLSGYSKEEVEGKMTWMTFFPEEDLVKMKKYRAQRRVDPDSVPMSYETCFIDRDGNIRNIYLSTALIPGSTKAVASLLDLTDLKRLEAQLLQSQKIEAIGQLAGGVAHDFNNILTAIIGYASLLQMNINRDDPHRAYVDSILSSSERATHLTQGLLAFSRKQVIAPKTVDLNKIIRKVEQLLRRLMGEDIELRTAYHERPVIVFADPGQLEQVLINLATNARDAMVDGGCFSIATSFINLDEASSEKKGFENPGRYASITISDNGEGVDKKAMEHIFEPFFTTKEVGKGTGLGLSIVYGIIKQHNGYIYVSSEKGSGTTFTIYLPLMKSLIREDSKTEQRVPVGGHETILLAEDDKHIRVLIKEVLEKYGYQVILAENGDHALIQFEDHKDLIDLVILDVIMPKKNGRVVYEFMKEIKPDTKALFISGYTADIIHKKGIFEEDINFLAKPIVPDTIVLKVRDILDRE
ncbi:MAG: hypothetical protein C0392_05410 [Syntrophus sp. (in: bacteria)]|nr:hypothetical protein [Syntrophus sp. (in: bacteria)]